MQQTTATAVHPTDRQLCAAQLLVGPADMSARSLPAHCDHPRMLAEDRGCLAPITAGRSLVQQPPLEPQHAIVAELAQQVKMYNTAIWR